MKPTTIFRILAAAAFSAALTAGQGAQAPKATPPSSPEAAPPRPDGLKSRLFLLQHIAPDSHLVDLLRPLGSGNYWAGIQATDIGGVRAITARDFPENLAVIEEAIKRLDVPAPAAKQVEFHIHVLLASKQDGAGSPVPEEIQDALASLKSTLNYRSYTPIAAFVQRAADGLDFIPGSGTAEMPVKTSRGEVQMETIDLGWNLQRLNLSEVDGKTEISVRRFEVETWEHVGNGHGASLARIATNLTMKSGEKVVVGTSMIRDKALIVVLTAKTLD